MNDATVDELSTGGPISELHLASILEATACLGLEHTRSDEGISGVLDGRRVAAEFKTSHAGAVSCVLSVEAQRGFGPRVVFRPRTVYDSHASAKTNDSRFDLLVATRGSPEQIDRLLDDAVRRAISETLVEPCEWLSLESTFVKVRVRDELLASPLKIHATFVRMILIAKACEARCAHSQPTAPASALPEPSFAPAAPLAALVDDLALASPPAAVTPKAARLPMDASAVTGDLPDAAVVGEPSRAAEMMELLRSPDRATVMAAVDYFQNVSYAPAALPLIAIARTATDDQVIRIVRALGNTGLDVVENVLLELLVDTQRDQQLEIVRVLERLGTRVALPHLRRLAKEGLDAAAVEAASSAIQARARKLPRIPTCPSIELSSIRIT